MNRLPPSDSWRGAFLAVLIGCLLPALVVPADAAAYASGRRPLTSFMKSFADLSSAALEHQRLVDQEFLTPGFLRGDISKAAAAGKAFYEAHQNRFDKLYQEAGKILSEAPPLFDRSLLDKPRIITPTIDFRFSRSIVRCFQLVALYHFEQQKYEDAVKTLLLSTWFSHAVARGEGDAPVLIDLMISIAIRNIAVSEILWASLAQGDFEPAWLHQVENILAGLETTQPSFAESLEWELTGTLNALRNELAKSSNTLVPMPSQLLAPKRQELTAAVVAHLQQMHQRLLNAAAAFRLDPIGLRRETQAAMAGIEERAQPRMSFLFSVSRKISSTIEAISMPNFSRAYDQYLKARYREKGTIMLVRFLIHRQKGAPLPADGKAFAKAAQAGLPRDLYSSAGDACRYVLDDTWMTIYSVGPDQADDGGDAEKDFLLFKLPVAFLK